MTERNNGITVTVYSPMFLEGDSGNPVATGNRKARVTINWDNRIYSLIE